MKNKILIINGVNLNLQGKREQHIYGNCSFDDFLSQLKSAYEQQADIDFFQSNSEQEIIDKIQQSESYNAVIINAGAFTHTSLAIADAIRSVNNIFIEVHISNIFARENYRQHSYLSSCVKGCIVGLGLDVYRLAIEHILSIPRQRV